MVRGERHQPVGEPVADRWTTGGALGTSEKGRGTTLWISRIPLTLRLRCPRVPLPQRHGSSTGSGARPQVRLGNRIRRTGCRPPQWRTSFTARSAGRPSGRPAGRGPPDQGSPWEDGTVSECAPAFSLPGKKDIARQSFGSDGRWKWSERGYRHATIARWIPSDWWPWAAAWLRLVRRPGSLPVLVTARRGGERGGRRRAPRDDTRVRWRG